MFINHLHIVFLTLVTVTSALSPRSKFAESHRSQDADVLVDHDATRAITSKFTGTYFKDTFKSPLTERQAVDVGLWYVLKNLRHAVNDKDLGVRLTHSYFDKRLHYIYALVTYKALDILNLHASVFVRPNGEILTATFPRVLDSDDEDIYYTRNVLSNISTIPKVNDHQALLLASKHLEMNPAAFPKGWLLNAVKQLPQQQGVKTMKLGLYLNEKKVELCYQLRIVNDDRKTTLYISAINGKIVSMTDKMYTTDKPRRTLVNVSNHTTTFGFSHTIPPLKNSTTIKHIKKSRRDPMTADEDVIMQDAEDIITSQPTYRAIPFNYDNIKQGTHLFSNPADPHASPSGWHFKEDDGEFVVNGNNLMVVTSDRYRNPDSTRIQFTRSVGKVFDFEFEEGKTPAENVRAAVVNSFYVANRFHDILYYYGFTEDAGNFQNSNFGKGGKDKDGIQVIVNYPKAKNNAFFLADVDGVPGKLCLGIFKNSKFSIRNTALDNNILIHELTHGLSERLVGGANTADCLSSSHFEAEAISEGWSDTVGWVFAMKESDTRSKNIAFGWYSEDNLVSGIRDYPYSTDQSINPLMYAEVREGEEGADCHDTGAIFSTMLYEVYWNMVEKSGFHPDYAVVEKMHGNTRFLQLIVDSMKLVPCHPRFIDVRNAMLAADKAAFGGLYQCEIWNGFAKRGLGSGAQYKRFENNRGVPRNCIKSF